MSKYQITNRSVSYYVPSISVTIGAGRSEIDDALSNAEMDISVDWGENWAPADWDSLRFDYESPDTSKEGTTTLVGYVGLRKFEKQDGVGVELEYRDAWGIVQDKIPICIQTSVVPPEDD